MNSFVHRPNPLKAVASTKETVFATTVHTHSPSRPCNSKKDNGGAVGMWNEIRSKYAFSFAAAHSAECARAMSILDGRRLGRGLEDWCERQDRFWLDLHINREGVAGPNVQGGKGQRCANFPSYCARKLAGRYL